MIAVEQPDTGLVVYDEMVHSIAECVRVDEAKDIRDKALALEKYMAQAGNLEAERQCINVRLRAERRCGELLAEREKAKGARLAGRDALGGSIVLPPNDTPTIAELGISKTQSSRFQQLAEIPEQQFDALMNGDTKQSTAGLIRAAKEQPAKAPKMDPAALWLWGRLRDFERHNLLGRDPADVLSQMTDAMQADVKRLAPAIAAWFTTLEGVE